ncbi:hypothetical protein Tco_0002256 [Tanacetum coccineum]
MACDVSWKSKVTKLMDENVLLKDQVESTVQERENIKLEFQMLFNSIKATHVQHQQEVSALVENYNQKTYAYADVRAKNQVLLLVISELRTKLAKQANNVNAKSNRYDNSGKLVCVTPINKNIAVKAKKVSLPEDKTDRSNPVTSHSTPQNEQTKENNTNVIARGMYKLPKP